jgi:DNA invertase Pin-like site-specific DNA recombinase
MSKVIGYCRVSIEKTQTTENQKLLILDYAHNQKLTVDEIVEVSVSSRKDKKFRLIDETIDKLQNGDTLLVYALDRLGRSTIETLTIIEEIKNKGIKLVLIKDNIIIDKNDSNPMNEMMLTMLSGFAQLERSYISERTKLGLARVKANGKQLGRKKGQQVKSIFDEYKEKIIELKELGVTNKRIHDYINIGTVQSLGKYIISRSIAA